MATKKISMKKLPEPYLQVLKEYAAARDARRALEAEARVAARTQERLQARILTVMAGAEVAVCGDLVVTVKRTADVVPTLTLRDESVVPWSEVTAVVIGNARLEPSDVVSLYGGRAGSVNIMTAPRGDAS